MIRKEDKIKRKLIGIPRNRGPDD